MLAALRTLAVQPHVGDVDVTRQHIDVDAGMVDTVDHGEVDADSLSERRSNF